MKPILITCLLPVILLLSCHNSDKLILVGNLGNAPTASLELKKDGEQYTGFILYAGAEKKKIPVRGSLDGKKLLLDEFSYSPKKPSGKLEGTFDGTTYRGHWTAPGKSKKVPFAFRIKNGKTVPIKYATISQYLDNAPIYQGLTATIGEKKYTILEAEDNEYNSAMCIDILDVRDFNGDGYEDALIEHIEACGGWAVPTSSLFFCIYDPVKDRFVESEPFASTDGTPEFKKVNGEWHVLLTSYSYFEMYRAEQRYVLRDTEVVLLKSIEAQPIKALAELTEPGMLLFDLDGDGGKDSIITYSYHKWNSMTGELRFSNGKLGDWDYIGFHRLGVLPEKTRNVHNLVMNLDDILVWNGKKYVSK